MFYELEKIENQLKCPICLQKFTSPRILPCGKSICQNCIEDICLKQQLEYQNAYRLRHAINDKQPVQINICPFCEKCHQALDENGFILNDFIIKTSQLRPEKVYRCSSYNYLDELLNTLENDLKELISKIQYPEARIREHCEKVRNQIDLATETLIEKVSKFRENYLNEIDQYEKNCLKIFKELDKKETHNYQKLIKENESRIQTLSCYVNQPKIDEDKVKKLIEDAKLQEYNLKNQLKLLNGRLFGKEMPHFDEYNKSIESNIIGHLNYENLEVFNDMINVDKLIDPKVEKIIEHSNVSLALPLLTLKDSYYYDDKYLVLSENLLKIINDSHSLVEIRFDFIPDYISVNNKDSIFVQHYRYAWKNNRREKSSTHTLSIYDYNLNLNYENTSEYTILNCTTTPNNIFVQIALNNAIVIYNWHLEKISTIGQDSYIDRPYFFRDFLLKMVKNDKIYLKKVNADDDGDYWIRIVSLRTGELLNECYLNNFHDHFFIDALNRIVIIDEIFSNLKIYDKPSIKSNQAKLIYEKNIDLTNSCGLKMTADGRFFFIKNKKKINFYSFCV